MSVDDPTETAGGAAPRRVASDDQRRAFGGAVRRAFANRRRPLRRSVVWPLAVSVVAALVQFWPFLSRDVVSHGEFGSLIACIAEARAALREGQFPIRVMPYQHRGARYALFQFYGNLPFTAAGAVAMLPGADAYSGLKFDLFAALVCGGYFACLTARRLTRHRSAWLWAGPVFLLSPYVFTDLHARGAACELIGLCLMPAAAYATLRCFASPRRRYVAGAAVAWAALLFSHNITYLYAIPFVGTLVLLRARPRRRGEWRRLARLAAAGVLHGLLVAWYVAPQLVVVKHLNINAYLVSPMTMAWLVRWPALLAPTLTLPEGSTTPRLGLQIGWPILAGAAGAVGLLFRCAVQLRRRDPDTLRAAPTAVAALLGLFLVAVFFAWSPVDFWRYVRGPLYFVQFPYRLLGFAAVWGAILTACVLGGWFPRGLSRAVTLFGAIILAQSAASYVFRAPMVPRGGVAATERDPVLFTGGYDYLVSSGAASKTSDVFPALDLARWEFAITDRGGALERIGPVTVPVPPGATALRVDGEVADDVEKPVHLTCIAAGARIDFDVPAGAFSVRAPLGRIGQPTVLVEFAAGAGNMDPDLRYTSIRWEGAAPGEGVLMPAEQVRPTFRRKRVSRTTIALDRPTTVELPMLYYPGLLHVTDNGRRIAYGNVGRFVALDLPAGEHYIEATFAGVTWANAAGVGGVGVLIGMFAVPFARRWRARRRRVIPVA